MNRKLLIISLCLSQQALAEELQPVVSLKGLFRNAVAFLPSWPTSDARAQSSELDRLSGGLKAPDKGLSLTTSERDIEAMTCAAACGASGALNINQRRGGLAWNFDSDDSGFRLTPHAEVVRFQMLQNGQLPSGMTPGMGFGVGLDGSFRFSSQTSAYASAGRLQLSDRSANEGMVGLAHQMDRSRVFLEAKWIDLNHQPGLDNSYSFSNVRVGISRSFSGL